MDLERYDYFLGKKYKLLYNLYHEIYCLLCLSPVQLEMFNNDGNPFWTLYIEEEGVFAEISSSKLKSLDERLSLHKQAYRRLKALLNTKSLKFNKDGLTRLF